MLARFCYNRPMIEIFDTHTHLNVDNFAGKEQEEIVVSPVKEFKATTINKKNVTVSWEEPENAFGLESYILYKDGKKVSEISSDETSYTFKGLNRHTIYNFKIATREQHFVNIIIIKYIVFNRYILDNNMIQKNRIHTLNLQYPNCIIQYI